MQEIWKPVKGYEGIYEVSNLGRVKSLPRTEGKYYFKGRILNPHIANGYNKVALSVFGKAKQFSVHRLVADAFIPNPEGKATVNHKDENKLNNRADNLEWLTHSENLRYGERALRTKETITKLVGVPVYQVDTDMRTVFARYDSLSEAAREHHTGPGNIQHAADVKGLCKGWFWVRECDIDEKFVWVDTGKSVFESIRGEKTRK